MKASSSPAEFAPSPPIRAPLASGLPDVQRHARAAGMLYVALFFLGPMVFLGGKAVALVPGDPAATAEALRAIGPSGLRTGLVIESLIFLIELVLAGILYVIFRPVQHAIALAASLARFAEAVVQGANLLPGFVLLALIGVTTLPAVFPPDQSDALAYLFLEANGFMILVWGLFFGLHVALLAWLVYQSGFLPRWIGILLGLAATGYLAQGFGIMLLPELRPTLDTLVVVLAVPGELAFTVWLLFRGVDREAWVRRTVGS